jgi:phospholipase C
MASIADVKHVVILMQENRSFDEYFGMLRGVRGFFDTTGAPVFAQHNAGADPPSLFPFHVDTHTTSGETMKGNSHSWGAQHVGWNSGAMDGWRSDQADTVMGYFDRYDIPFHTALAQSFTICDSYFCSVLGPTAPNRMYLMSGMIDPGGTQGGPQIKDLPKAVTPLFGWKSYPRALSDAGVSWAIYDEQAGHVDPPFDLNVTRYFSDWVESPTTHRTGDHQFEADLLLDKLPTVSWIVPPYNYTEHPEFAPANGAYWLASKIQAFMTSPYWSNTVFVLTYDENDGAFDHVAPPVAPAGTADELVDGAPIGPGFRVPCIVISPWTVGGRVASQPFDHTSVLRLLETVTGVKCTNISAYRRNTLHNLSEVLDFSTTVNAGAVPRLPAAPAYTSNGLPPPVAPNTEDQAPVWPQLWPPSRSRLAAIGWLGGHAYFFCGPSYLRYTTGTTGTTLTPDAGYPKSIAAEWPGVTFVDAGVAYPDGKAYVFSDHSYVRYSSPPGDPDAVAGSWTLDAGYPNRIWNNWSGFWAADFDAVTTWNDGYTYFFKGTEYVRCLTDGHVAESAPQPIASRFPGVIAAFSFGIDAAVVWSASEAYFFKGTQYVRYNLSSNAVDEGPKSISVFSSALMTLYTAGMKVSG